jgi:hypothetical protein
MVTPHADSYLMPTLTRPSRKWERYALIAGLCGVVFSAGAIFVALKGERAPKIESAPLIAPAPAPPPPPEPVVESTPDAGLMPEPKKTPVAAKRKSRKLSKKKIAKSAPPPPTPPTPPEEEKKDLLHMRLEDLVESEKK